MLEIKIILHPASGGPSREIGGMQITQVAQGEGTLRDYSVSAWHFKREPVRLKLASVVASHDRLESVWALIYKAIAGLR